MSGTLDGPLSPLDRAHVHPTPGKWVPDALVGDLVRGRNGRKKLDRNTYARVDEDGTVSIRFHATDILRFTEKGVVLNTGGWHTLTTLGRMREFIGAYDLPFGVETTGRGCNGPWEVVLASKDRVPLFDGLVLGYDGQARNARMNANDRDLAMVRSIDRYVHALGRAIREGSEWDPNPGGDCFYCQMREVGTGKPMGDVSYSPHLREHVKEEYVQTSLILNALAAKGYPYPAIWVCEGGSQTPSKAVMDRNRKTIMRAVRSYLTIHLVGKARGPARDVRTRSLVSP